VVVSTDPEAARAAARAHLAIYLNLPNYVNNLRRLGFDDDDVTAPGSDRLIDAVVAWGDEATISRRVQAHRDAGADHVAVQVIPLETNALPLEEWRRLAPALNG
jgi:probable F420-dependent oxidoreductase